MATDWLFVSEHHICDLRVAGIMVNEGKILVQRDMGGSVYALPGGHVQVGETLEASLKREFREEADIDVVCRRMLWSEECFWTWKGKQAHHIAFYYRIDPAKDAILPKDNGPVPHKDNPDVVFQWLPIEDVQNVVIYPSFLKTEIHRLHGPVRHFVSKD